MKFPVMRQMPVGLHLIVLLCAAAAVLLAAILSWKGRGRRSLPGCGIGSSCAAVTSGRWSRLGPIRVVNLGLLIYAAMLIAAGCQSVIITVGLSSSAVLLATSVMVVGAALWFTLLQVAARQWCPWCAATHAVALIGGVVVLRSTEIGSATALPIGIGVVAVIALALGQLILKPKLYALIEAPPQLEMARNADDPAQAVPASSTAHEMPAAATALGVPAREPLGVSTPELIAHAQSQPPRPEAFLHGRVTFDINEWPILGSRAARHLVVDLFDYTCHQCRSLHGHLRRLLELYPDELAAVMVPMPQDSRCNRFVTRQDPHHLNACEYARYALAVWQALPEKFAEFDAWLFDPTRVPTVDDARLKAEALVGYDRFQQSLADPCLDRRVRDGIDIYMAAGAGPLPQLLLRDAAMLGQVPSFEVVHDVLKRRLGLGVRQERTPSPRSTAAPAARLDVYVISVSPNEFGIG